MKDLEIDFWERVDAALVQGRNRAQTLSEVNRLCRKLDSSVPPLYVTESNTTLKQEWLTPKQLDAFKRGHDRNTPRHIGGPLIAINHRGTTFMLDGTNRINMWLKQGNTEMHEVIILSPQSQG